MGLYSEDELKELFYTAVSTFETAGLVVKDIFFDDFEYAVKERDIHVERQKKYIRSDSFRNSEQMALLQKFEQTFDKDEEESIDDTIENYVKSLDSMPYHFETPYVEFYYPENGILIPLITNNMPWMMEVEFIRFNGENDDKDDYDESSRYHFADGVKFRHNHQNEKPVLAISILSTLTDITDASNYAMVREQFFTSLLDLSKEVLQGASQFNACMQFVEITEKQKEEKKAAKKPANKKRKPKENEN